jgi:hypothetical protein
MALFAADFLAIVFLLQRVHHAALDVSEIL